MPGPRGLRGVRHTLTSLLLAAVAAVLAGARSFTAVGEWAADAPPQVLAVPGIRVIPWPGGSGHRVRPPSAGSWTQWMPVRWILRWGSWLAGRLRGAVQGQGQLRRARRALAVDGKAVRGTRHASSGGQGVHVLAAAGQRASTVLAQASVDGKSNEITCFAPLLEPLDLAGCVITADAVHTRPGHAKFLVSEKEAGYILVVKNNQPSLYAQVKNLPWRGVPVSGRQHGRGEHHTLKTATVAAGLAFPHAAQALRATGRIRPLPGKKKWRAVTIYAVTSLTVTQAAPAQFAGWIRGHWGIENCSADCTYE